MAYDEIRGGDVGLRGVEEEWALLMRAAIGGDSTAYRRLLASLTPVLRTVTRRNCARIGLDGGEAEDIVQEVLLAIHLKRHTWDVDRPFGPWIMTIARNKLIDARRRRGNRLTLPIDDLADILTAEGSDDATDRGDLDRLLGGLGERQRDLVRSLSVEGRSVQETAARLKMSEGAVRVALHRAIKALAALYRGNGDEN
ncbi:sigma-70 family RNA polymerase sigma factor [Rhodoblastus sp.]|uniref:sigma-70 family RNA polymerase sigma factor n=1 Tax=Rhodoblastus sp. TaxID=1962975 RepID=UPI003F9705C2